MSDRDHAKPLALADRLVRVLVAAKAQALKPDALLAGLAHLCTGSDELFAGIDHTFTRLTVQARWPSTSDQSADFLSYHAKAFPAQHGRLAVLRDRPRRVHMVELETAAGTVSLGSVISSVGPRAIGEDVKLVARSAELDEQREADLAEIASRLATARTGQCDAVSDRCDPAGTNSYALRFARTNRSPEEQAATGAAILGAAEALGVCEAHRDFARKTIPILAGANVCLASVWASDAELRAELTLEYADVAWESALRLMRGFSTDADPASRLGALAGVANRETCMLRMVLGDGGMPGLTVWTAI